MSDNQMLLAECRSLIEARIAWGSSRDWQTQDFENLGDLILKDTGVMLSASTLKRLWGKVQYNSNPNLTTLDALARFAGFENWRAFCADRLRKENSDSATAFVEPIEEKSLLRGKDVAAHRSRNMIRISVVSALALAVIILVASMMRVKPETLRFNNISFSSKPVTSGVPNTVIFTYNAEDSNADSVFIQQSWDSNRRFRVDKQGHEFTSTYYLPGLYRAKLVLNDSIIKEHNVFIESEGWMGAIANSNAPNTAEPLYLGKSIFKSPGIIGVSAADFDSLNVDDKVVAPRSLLTYISKKDAVASDNFQLDLQIQNTYTGSRSACNYVEIVLFGTDGILRFPMSKKGCVGELTMVIGRKFVDGKKNDLSAFGVDFSKPVSVHCASKDNQLVIQFDGKTVYTESVGLQIGDIIGAAINFDGYGNISSYQLKSSSN